MEKPSNACDGIFRVFRLFYIVYFHDFNPFLYLYFAHSIIVKMTWLYKQQKRTKMQVETTVLMTGPWQNRPFIHIKCILLEWTYTSLHRTHIHILLNTKNAMKRYRKMCDHRPTILLKIQHASCRCSVWMENPSGIIAYRMVYPSYYFTFCLDGKPSKYQWMGNPSCS